jgi:hypothetical protein
VSSSTKLYTIYHTGLGSPACVSVQLTVPTGAWVRLAWVRQPTPASAPAAVDDDNMLINVAATCGDAAPVPLSSVSRVVIEAAPSAAADWQPPAPHAFDTDVAPGTIISYFDIGGAAAA